MSKTSGNQIYPGFWDGYVVDVKAPTTQPAGAVKVRIPDIHGMAVDVPDISLPWAMPNFMFAGLQCGIVGVPPLNAIVNIIFKHGDKNFPMWIGGGHRTVDIPTEVAAGKQGLEPKSWMWITPGGYGIVMNELLKTIEIKTPIPSTSSIKIDLTAKKVEVVSASDGVAEYKLVLDETAQSASLITSTGYKFSLDETIKSASLVTPAGYELSLDETVQAASMVTPSGQKVELDEASGEATVSGTTKAILTAAFIEIGLNPTEAVILGNAFSITWMNHGHPYTWAGPVGGAGVTGGPIPGSAPPGLPLVAELSLVTKAK